ncbi:acyltransferase family protein [Paraburkholderia graminis]|jgi:peptidoglycan/LPS O-acetylase OafA/YrhL|uniref:Peptidoglycan/LPS O-acetylase OafA/YrhL n=1 Tax=Paraburkholderia graminis TaxID=60548 RepID=A0ABD5CE89_9BURK|nr:acyltransferase [Paraburkholderia graminis]MDQ0623697.1 peptidoglycan/LPS O-acetylase OafA/YrhL [Paraburkholderia graminis]MDR6203368.1 peptidoglycan/LPS O-acetylase OafA/YrhL [Paraburkholderia graminis]
MHPLSHALSRNGNNFDLVRLVAAVAVVYGHSYLLQAPDGSSDWVHNALGFDGFGALGVYAFFLLSGMLVTASFDRQRSAPRFAVLRIARLWPAVALGSLVTVFIVGPLFTTLPLREYFSSGMTWSNLDNFSTIVMNTGWALPGVFEHNRFPVDVSSPLWTLPLQVRCYLIVLAAGMLGLLSSPRGALLAAALGIAAFVLRVHLPPHLTPHSLPLVQIGLRDFSETPGGYSFWPEPFFMLGVLLYGLRERIDIHGLMTLALTMVFLVFRDTAGAQPLFYLAFVYGVLWVGTTPLLRRFVPRHDYSYGIYLYGFMVQQCVANIAPQLSHVTAVLIAAPFIVLCAALSWHCVERPVLMWCRARLARPRAVRADARPASERGARETVR